MADLLFWKVGGNPPRPPRLYRGALCIADWPAGYEPNRVNISLIELVYDAKGARLSRDDVREALREFIEREKDD